LNPFLHTPIEYLKGVGPARAELLKRELNIFTFNDLLYHFPFRYIDKSVIYKVKDIKDEGAWIQLKGFISEFVIEGVKQKRRLKARFHDDTGSIELVWFQGIKWAADFIKPNTEYVIYGKPALFNHKFNIPHPELELATEHHNNSMLKFMPVYNTTELLKAKGLESRQISKLQKQLIFDPKFSTPENIPDPLLEKFKLISRVQAFRQIHFPQQNEDIISASRRLKFEELFLLQVRLARFRQFRKNVSKGYVFNTVGENFNTFFNNHLPFELTNAQKRVVKEVRNDMRTGNQMNRLLQGDVGSGKTLVALLCMLIAIDNGHQAALMAPTEILAWQHYSYFCKMLKDLPLNIRILTGTTKKAERKNILAELEAGTLHILIGTHALIENEVEFKNLGLAIIDEQHRFGVEQRGKLWNKYHGIKPHVLVMTATPIPRTLAMTVYGDLDLSIIDELPKGRKPISTYHRSDTKRLAVFDFMKTEISKRRQVYIVYPLIEESEKLDLKNLMAGYDLIEKHFPRPQYHVSIVHGKMPVKEKELGMELFLKNESQIMVATTVIEVGVDVPNASIMLIENAERFGLSQLHQLRGRVGRGAEQSYCILMTGFKVSQDARVRIETMCRTNDGFEIADTDLKLRGPGDLQGTRQSGVLDLKISDIARDQQLVKITRIEAIDLIEDDPALEKEINLPLKTFLEESETKGRWENIA
jgi:ATP-dependent DNA helicase RecG